MELPRFKRLPRHLGVIPDGNRRWAAARGLPKAAGYAWGIDPGFQLYELCRALGIPELTLYGFTQDNTRLAADQKSAFQSACVEAVERLAQLDAALLVLGDSESEALPRSLLPYTTRTVFGRGSMKINFLVNYGWRWDVAYAFRSDGHNGHRDWESRVASSDVSRLDLIVRWGGRRRLSGFLPLQSMYADFYIVDALWPDYCAEHLIGALHWYESQGRHPGRMSNAQAAGTIQPQAAQECFTAS